LQHNKRRKDKTNSQRRQKKPSACCKNINNKDILKKVLVVPEGYGVKIVE
jgi:hypothetical protein